MIPARGFHEPSQTPRHFRPKSTVATSSIPASMDIAVAVAMPLYPSRGRGPSPSASPKLEATFSTVTTPITRKGISGWPAARNTALINMMI